MKKKRNSSKGETRVSAHTKGRIVEQIAAWMHWSPDVTVATNVRFPTRSGERKREIDVLICRQIVGYPIYIAIECKNEEKAIGVGKIDEFIGKLQDIDIPVQHGIYISASGYTRGAIERAVEVGIQPLRLKGLTKQQLAEAVMTAFEATIYLCLQVVSFPMIEIPSAIGINHFAMFCDLTGYPVGSLLDLITDQWNTGNIPGIIGSQEINIAIPPHWYHLQGNKLTYTSSLSVKVHVHGLVATRQGLAREYQLINDKNGVVEKHHLYLNFGKEPETEYLTSIVEEEQLKALLQQSDAPAILQCRYRLPRILLKELVLWPLSEHVIRLLIENLQASKQGVSLPHDLHFVEFAEGNMARVFDPVWTGPTSDQDQERLFPLLTQIEDEMRQTIQQKLKI